MLILLQVIIKPCAIYKDPFRRGDNILVMCDTYTPNGKPLAGNTRFDANRLLKKTSSWFSLKIHPKSYKSFLLNACLPEIPKKTRLRFNKALEEEPWFGIEQEYTLFEKDGNTPLGWPKNGFPRMQGPYYCSAGTDCAYGRLIADAHAKACLYAGINISGTNAEVMPGQWEYQVGPCTGIASGDQTWMSRYLMIRVCEHFGVNVSFEPKPIPGDWNGAGCHTNYSTKEMREPGGFKVIIESVERLAPAHMKHIAAYGKDNELRLTGKHETCAIDEFKYGVANRGASVRIPNETKNQGYGYFEDRRPASNMDPYIVTSLLFETSTLGKPEYDGKRELVEPKSPGSRSNGASRKLEKQSSTTGFRSPRAELGGVKPGYPKA